jgi:hypothetical protein
MDACITGLSIEGIDQVCPLCSQVTTSVEEHQWCLRFSGCLAGILWACADRCGGSNARR